MSLLRKSLVTTFGKGAGSAIQLVNGIIIARWLGTSGTGQFQVPDWVNLFLATAAGLGIGQASIYFINNQRVPIARVTTTIFYVTLIWGATVALGLWLLYSNMQAFLGHLPAGVLICVACAGASRLMTDLLRPVLMAELRANRLALTDVTQTGSQTLVIAVMAFTGVLSVHAALITPLIGSLAAFAVVVWSVRRHIDFAMRPDWSLLRGLIDYGVRFASANIVLNAHTIAPGLMLRQLLGFDQVGLYRTAMSLCGLISIIGAAATPLLYAAWSGVNDAGQRARMVEAAARFYSFIGLCGAVAIFIVAGPLLRLLYGEAFVPAAPILRVLVFGTVIMLVAFSVQNLFLAVGRPMIVTALFLITVAVNVGTNGLLIPLIGELGAAIAATGASAVYLAGTLVMARRIGGVRIADCFIPRRDDFRRVRDAMLRRTVSKPDRAPPESRL